MTAHNLTVTVLVENDPVGRIFDTHGGNCQTLNPTPHTLHPAPCTLHPTPYTLHPTPFTLHPTPCTLHPTPYTLQHTTYTRHPTPYTLHPTPYTLHPTPYTRHPTPGIGSSRSRPSREAHFPCWHTSPCTVAGSPPAAWGPQSSEHGTYTTVTAGFWPWLSGQSP